MLRLRFKLFGASPKSKLAARPKPRTRRMLCGAEPLERRDLLSGSPLDIAAADLPAALPCDAVPSQVEVAGIHNAGRPAGSGNPLPSWQVDSFFDITYRIDFATNPNPGPNHVPGGGGGAPDVVVSGPAQPSPDDWLVNDLRRFGNNQPNNTPSGPASFPSDALVNDLRRFGRPVADQGPNGNNGQEEPKLVKSETSTKGNTTTTTNTYDNGTKEVIQETTQSNGTKVKTTTTEKPCGEKTVERVVTRKDGSSVTTTTTKKCDGSGTMVQVTKDKDGNTTKTVSAEYDNKGRKVKQTEESGGTKTEWTRDRDKGWTKTTTDAEGNKTTSASNKSPPSDVLPDRLPK